VVTAGILRDPQSNNAWVAAVLNNHTTGQTLTLRDASGLPLWVRRGNSGHTGFGGGPGQSARQGQGFAALRSGQPSIDLRTPPNEPQRRKMPDWAWIILIFAGYIALQRWVLPRLGVQT
jgi:hypothetical protein